MVIHLELVVELNTPAHQPASAVDRVQFRPVKINVPACFGPLIRIGNHPGHKDRFGRVGIINDRARILEPAPRSRTVGIRNLKYL